MTVTKKKVLTTDRIASRMKSKKEIPQEQPKRMEIEEFEFPIENDKNDNDSCLLDDT